MKKTAPIRFVREYKMFGDRIYLDIVYASGRCVTVARESAPWSILSYMNGARATEQYDKVFKRGEVIYERVT